MEGEKKSSPAHCLINTTNQSIEPPPKQPTEKRKRKYKRKK